MKDKTQAITFWAGCSLLFAYFLHVANFPNELVVVLGGVLCAALVVQQKKFRIDAGICLLAVALSSYYVIINGTSGIFYAILYIPLVVYELGNYLAWSKGTSANKEKQWMMLLFAVILGVTIHGLLNSCMYYAGYVVPGTRRWQDFWSGEIVPGTQHAALFLPALALFLPAVLYFWKRTWKSGIVILVTMFFGYTSLVTKSRMSVLIFVIIVCVQGALYLWLSWDNVKMQFQSKKLWLAVLLLLAVTAAVFFAVKDSAVVTAFVENMGKGGGIINNIRFQAQGKALAQLFDHPMGGGLMELGGISHAHNVWLDMANAAGLIPFFAFTAYTVYTLYELVRLLRSKEIPTELKLIVAGLYGVFFLYFTVEPALEASVHLVTPWICVNGLIHGMGTQR